MSSGSKFSRGTGRGPFRPPHNRGLMPLRHGPVSSKKTSLGHSRDVTGSLGSGNGGTAGTSLEEFFQLLPQPSYPDRPFAMIMRLQPETLEELKHAEAEGIQAMMKFGDNAAGHVIQVGSQTFKFSSAPEPGDLCEIYEQKQGESGESVLVEAGCVWRRLSVQRILSATEKDRVKRRTAEAEIRQKQRKSILVDPNTQMIIPQGGVSEVNGRKSLLKSNKEPPPKKRRVTSSPIKQRPHSNTSLVAGSRQFASPASPPFDPPPTSARGIQTNQMNDSHSVKARAVSERVAAPVNSKTPPIQKEKPRTPVTSAVPDTVKTGSATNLTDLRNFLIGLLQDNPKGVTNKMIEKAVAEGLSGSAEKRSLEKVLKSVAVFHAPGKYLLNPGVEKGIYLESAPHSSSGRIQETVQHSTHDPEPSNSIQQRESVKEKEHRMCHDKGPARKISHPPEQSNKEISPRNRSPQPSYLDIETEDVGKQDVVPASKDPSSGGSDSSSSSGSGTGSDSDSESSGSGSGTESGSGTGSGSDTDSTSSSSGASVEEDVDIMSDDDAEKSKLDIKQKPKMKESKSLVKEDSRSHESNKFDEDIHASNFDDATEFEGTMDHANDLAVDTEGKMPSNIMEHVFGSEEIDDFGEDSEEHIRGEETVQGENLHSQFTEEKGQANLHSNKDFQSENNFEDTQKIYTGDSDALGTDAALDNLVERISESKDMETGVSGGNRGVPSTSQQDHKSFIKSGGYGPIKITDKRKVDSESVVRVNLDKKDRDVHPSTDGKGALKNITSYVEPNAHLENSHVEKDEPQQNINKVLPERLAQVSTEARKRSSKKSTTKGHEKFERAKTSDSTVKRKSPSNSAHIAGALKFDDERMDRLSDRGGAETCDFMEVKQKKEKVPDERTLDSSRSGDISGRQSRDFERHLQQKDSVGAMKGSAHRISRDSNYSSASYDKDALHMDKSSKMKHGRQKSETSDRTGLVVEQAERPLADVDSARKGKDLYGKSILKETESGGRISGGELSNVKAKDMGNLGESFQSHSRGHLRDNSRASMETFEARDPPVENGMVESKKRVPPMEDLRGKATSGAMGRFSYKGSLSPDQDDYQAFDRRSIDIQKQSPVKAFEDSRHHAYDGRNSKRRIDEVENTDLERSKRNANAGHSKQAQNKEEWFQTGSVKQGYVEKGKFSVSDFQDYKCASKFSAFENSVRSDEESDELYKQQRAGQTHATPNGMRRDNIRAAGDFVDNSKRQTPQSIELLEGSDYFAPYEKDKPDLRNQIKTFIEYKEYRREYCEKYPVYCRLHQELEKTRRLFENLKKDKEQARSEGDEKKSTFTNERIREEYNLHRKKRKRMHDTFLILHEELKEIKMRCKEFAEKVQG